MIIVTYFMEVSDDNNVMVENILNNRGRKVLWYKLSNQLKW